MVSAYSTFPNKGVRVQPHLIRKVYARDGSLLEEWQKTTSKVTSEYVALTMVEMMRGVCAGGGTAAGASAAGHQLAGKTGTVNDHTDVWFLGYTPTYVTGVWMGNPLRKENLGGNMTGGHGALPYFNAFMNAFMKDKPKDSFEKPPPIPSDIKSLIEKNKREELEKLEKADEAGLKTGIVFTPGTKITDPAAAPPGDGPATTNPTSTDTKPDNPSNPGGDPPVQKPPVSKPPEQKKPDAPTQPEGPKRKGKKGDGR
jgi:penicillin-binding protein 1A